MSSKLILARGLVQRLMILAGLLLLSVPTLDGQGGEAWNREELGNHRVVLGVGSQAQMVRVHVEWRRRDSDPLTKQVILIDALTGERVRNLQIVQGDSVSVDLVFQAKSASDRYYLYYMPYEMTGRSNYPTVTYLSAGTEADPDWLEGWNRISESDQWKDLPEARVIDFESVDPFNRFTQMEQVASPQEVSAFLERFRTKSFILFPEDRSNPIRIRNTLPLKWVTEGPQNPFEGTARPGEFYVFQMGVFAQNSPVNNLSVVFSPLVGAGDLAISEERFRCFNLGGVDWTGHEFESAVEVPVGSVQPLWLGLDVPLEAQAGTYEGRIEVRGTGLSSESIAFRLRVEGEKLVDRGDSEPSLLSRLRWLDSRIALDDSVVKPYVPLRIEGDEISLLGRRLKLGKNGLPVSIRSYFTPEMTGIGELGRELLARPIDFRIRIQGDKWVEWKNDDFTFRSEGESEILWQAKGKSGALELETVASLEFDGCLELRLSLKANEATEVEDILLDVPLQLDVARYMMGLGFKGGRRPVEFRWNWDQSKNQDSVWVGDVNAGLQVSWKDDNYIRPLNTNFYLLRPLNLPLSWYNNGNGGSHLKEEAGAFVIQAYSGPRRIEAGQVLNFSARLLITPFKPINPNEQWNTRYFHSFSPVEEVEENGANTINVHHANEINPFINYPFLRVEEMAQYIEQAHALGMRVKIYYTVRELSNRAYELSALKSLGNEVLAPGAGGGPSWLQEHLDGNYIAGWYVPKYRDAALINSGTSRWHNYYLEGLDWLVKNVKIDGIYIDDVAFDRIVMKRVRRILERGRPKPMIDLHSANQFNVRDGFANSANLYLEHFPFIDRLWFGEYFDYGSSPDFWMTELAGIPFGLMGEMLQDKGNPWRGMIYGMTGRLPWAGDPRPLWQLWDAFGMQQSRMIGYWAPMCPVKTDREDVLATVYAKEDEALVALASWNPEPVSVRLEIDWQSLGLDPARSVLKAVPVEGFQPERVFDSDEQIPLEPGQGWLLWIQENR